jgi:hypothetical protein
MVVMMQVVKLNAHKSVGENADASPLLSSGASVKISVPLWVWILLHRSFPRYFVVAVAMIQN